MRRVFPFSLVFFVATGIAFALQAMPIPGIYLMVFMAPFWSVFLVNAGSIGIAAEAATGRVSRWWLIVPALFYGGYWIVAAQEHLMLRKLSASYVSANAQVAVDFDSERQALVLEGNDGSGDGPWLTQNYALPIVYSVNANVPEGYLSNRMLDQAVRAKLGPATMAASVFCFGFSDERPNGYPKSEARFCTLSMPERPTLPQIRVSRRQETLQDGSLPVTRVTANIATPDGRNFQILTGHAAPLNWFPMPVIGCALISSAPSWSCSASFSRNRFTPIISGSSRHRHDTETLARALGLKPVAIPERRSADPEPVLAKIRAVEEATLSRQLANIDSMIRNPAAGVSDWQIELVLRRPDALESRADAIMAGIEHAATFTGNDRYRARESGRILARLLATLPHDRFVGFGSRILAIYAKADREHWLWDAEPLLRRLGDLGTDALPYLINPSALRPAINRAGVEGLCRVGSAGRENAEPILLALWTSHSRYDRDLHGPMFVALRRIGITPPPLADERFARLEAEWADISSASPNRVCAVDAERNARRDEKENGKRRWNME
ncbi:hypothetical protein [Bosea sp. CRIB-10]|uniref:hypothetical protein n=1 Tax=Bosea sp. CRIB-10 TaxID=378404 RepID=UPI000B8852D6|nr:hypothetical protein [Bosea sp. CRIB-10]